MASLSLTGSGSERPHLGSGRVGWAKNLGGRAGAEDDEPLSVFVPSLIYLQSDYTFDHCRLSTKL
jgi:hypothetical protein